MINCNPLGKGSLRGMNMLATGAGEQKSYQKEQWLSHGCSRLGCMNGLKKLCELVNKSSRASTWARHRRISDETYQADCEEQMSLQRRPWAAQ